MLQVIPGKPHALEMGYREALGELLIIVDDDNLLQPDYLEQAWQIHLDRPHMGVYAGSKEPRFEVAPPAESIPYHPHLAIRNFEHDEWTNLLDPNCWVMGAGMCITHEVVEAYLQHLDREPWARQLNLISSRSAGEDHDVCYVAQRMGWGCGHFARLKLTHIIPAARLDLEYLQRLVYENKKVGHYLKLRYGAWKYSASQTWKWRLLWGLLFLQGKHRTNKGLSLKSALDATVVYLEMTRHEAGREA
jgi:cellulose synthase/poly-beta-1,6-N-acetylglucosamine synthase-like glycosyltransferase